MGLRNSRSIRMLREEGWKFPSYLYNKIMRKTSYKICASFKFGNYLFNYYLYPKLVLNKHDYKFFLSLQTRFKQNYKSIIAINPAFFRSNLLSHINWMYSNDLLNASNEQNMQNHTVFNNAGETTPHNNVFPPPPPIVAKPQRMR